MRNRFLSFCLALFTLLTLASCGGGGSSAGVSSQAVGTVISGVVAKGIFSSGTVNCYLVSPQGNNYHLTSVPINGNGVYSVNIGSYRGIVLLEVSSGIYYDEATDNPAKALAVPLRAVTVITATGGRKTVSITPLTELAVRKAYSLSNPLTAADVATANAMLSDIFPFDIIQTSPLPLYDITSGTAEQKCYSLVLAGVSMYGVASFISDFAADLTTPPFMIDQAKYLALNTKTLDFLALGAPRNPTGYTTLAQIPKYDMIGWYSTTVTVSADSSGSSYTLANGIQFSLRINPAKFSIDTDPDHPNVPDSTVVTLTDPTPNIAAYGITSDTVSSWTVLNIALTYLNGISQGGIATVRIKTKPGEFPTDTDILLERIYQGNAQTATPYTSNSSIGGPEWTLSRTY